MKLKSEKILWYLKLLKTEETGESIFEYRFCYEAEIKYFSDDEKLIMIFFYEICQCWVE